MDKELSSNRREKPDTTVVCEGTLFASQYGGLTCSVKVLKGAHVDGDRGIVTGYLLVDSPGSLANVLRPQTSQPDGTFINTDDLPHTYETTSGTSGTVLKAQGHWFFNVVLSRYRDSSNIFTFMGKVAVESFKTFEENNTRRHE